MLSEAWSFFRHHTRLVPQNKPEFEQTTIKQGNLDKFSLKPFCCFWRHKVWNRKCLVFLTGWTAFSQSHTDLSAVCTIFCTSAKVTHIAVYNMPKSVLEIGLAIDILRIDVVTVIFSTQHFSNRWCQLSRGLKKCIEFSDRVANSFNNLGHFTWNTRHLEILTEAGLQFVIAIE